ncbi:DUF3080 family protein [Halomonas sp.]|uniref:DUF3080 family protein n=1 Tax=Halomonas sp. TaxID=1486246 RepID=UPI0025B7BD40|nr:DUF3080 family protein [Halomonas sp.]
MRWASVNRGLVTLLIAGLGGLLTACGSGGDSNDLLIDYQRDLARRLDLAPPSPASPDNIGAFPGQRERLVTIPETREGMLNVFALRECHITTLVAERNSTLGRVAPASQVWRYELTLWQRLTDCLASEVPERLAEADRERLERLAATKTEQLPRAAWNGLFGSDEWAGSFSRVSSPLPLDALAPPEAQLESLVYLQALTKAASHDAPTPDLEALERHLRALDQRPYTAELLRTLTLATQRLDEASSLAERALARHDGCLTPALEEVEHDKSLARWLEALEGAAHVWLAGLEPLFDSLDSPPDAVSAYQREWLSREYPPAPLPAFEAARHHHQALRQALAFRCR